MRHFVHFLAAGLLFVSAAVPADTLYRWIDGSGRVQFSDTPPPEGTRGVIRFDGPAYVDSGVPADRYSISNQLERLEASKAKVEQDRRERERARREFELRQRELDLKEQQDRHDAKRDRVYVYPRTVRPGYPTYGSGLRPYRPRGLWDDHPAYRPGPRPTAPAPPGGYVVAPR